MLVKFIAIALLALTASAYAEEPQDQIWRELVSQKEAQSAQQIIDLARRLQDANKRISDLQQQLAEEKEKAAKTADAPR